MFVPAPAQPVRSRLLARAVASLALLLALVAALPARAGGALPPWASGESRAEDLGTFLVTFGPGNDIPSWWGHAALGVEDRTQHQARLYNYGMFDFDKFATFALGRLEFWVADAPVLPYLRFYRGEDRDVRLLRLNLDAEGRRRMAQHLAQNVLPEHRDYLYDHYRDNCSTRLRDAIDLAVGGQLKKALSTPGRMTLREHTRRYTSVVPAVSVLLDFAMNDTIDRPLTRWDEAFLPDELERAVKEQRYTNAQGQTVPLLERVDVFHSSTSRAPTPAEPPDVTPWLLLLGLAWGGSAALVAVWHARTGQALARVLLGLQTAMTGLVLGLLGTVVTLLWVLTDHTVTFRNENLFLANPLTLLALPLGVSLALGRARRTPERLRRLWLVLSATALLGLGLKVLPMFDQNNWNILALLLPVSLGFGAAFVRLPQRVAAPGAVPSL
ncbi:MAG: DUF4105 domain-containing protein [Myxococcaceae bacterium]|nr:DUF4105 domain-containing protein [Myxococcaceae bacterium]MCI0673975.1 DUF4105 domain-containing protein [Myxococcaceae bacterium]